MSVSPTLLWFRQDLRLQDNPALTAALKRGSPVIPVYILDDRADAAWTLGGASRWWLHHSLTELAASLSERGSRLILARGDAGTVLAEMARDTSAGAIYWNRRYEPAGRACDEAVEQAHLAEGRAIESFNASLLFEPHTIANKQGSPFQVFTPFWRHCLALPVDEPRKLRPGKFPGPASWPRSLELDALGLLPRIPWDTGFYQAWKPGEKAAAARLRKFLAQSVEKYAETRNRPDVDGTSQLSPRLHFGELGPRQVWAAVKGLGQASGVFPAHKGAQAYLAEIGWREFAHHLLYHYPATPAQPLRAKYATFPWAKDPGHRQLHAWQRGQTGYPVVDAGMRQLWATGWMHNRVRMIVASFLVKHLRLSWTHGATWFWDTLVDADLANNTLGWQWSAGCGADAAPYFRIFAPVLQGEKFDPDGDYVRQWVPELAKLPKSAIHHPWDAPEDVLAKAGVELGKTYPRPLVDHAQARAAALAAFKQLAGKP